MSDVRLYIQDGTAATLAAADEMGAEIDGHPVNGPDIPDFLASIGMRSASVADLVAALLNEGGEIVEPFGLWWTSRLTRELATANEPDDAEVFVLDVGKPGRYLVVPLEDE